MRRILAFGSFAIALTIASHALQAAAQQATVGSGMRNVGDSFFEGFNVGLNARGPNWFFNNGGGGAIPPFGGFDPNAGATLGFGFRGPGFSGGLNIGAAQGSSRGISSTAGSITIPNGGMGMISDTTLVPFVTGVVPVVGSTSSTMLDERLARLKEGETPRPIASSSPSTGSGSTGIASSRARSSSSTAASDATVDPLQKLLASAQQSSAGQAGGSSIAEIRRKQATDDAKLSQEVQSLLDQARAAKDAGKKGTARIYYEQAARKATGAQREEALAAIRALR